jgi:dienelactone hydrolase
MKTNNGKITKTDAEYYRQQIENWENAPELTFEILVLLFTLGLLIVAIGFCWGGW